jgi:signal transduction histidine kinase
VGLLLIDRGARIRYANAAIRAEGAVAAALLRPGERYADALRGLIDRGCFAGADPGAASMLAQASGAGAPAVGRHECQLSDGRRLLCSTRRLPGGEALVLRQDVPEAQARLTEIEALNRALETQMQRVGATNRALRALAYATAHDLRAPLNTATMLADLLFEEAAEAEARGLAADLRATLSGMARLIDDVRAYADAVNTEALNRDCDLHALAREALRARAPEIAASGARVALETLPRVRGHPVLLRQLLANLLDNALKFRAPDRALQLQLRACAGAAPGFSLSDNGIGIDAAYHERIFDLFQTLHPGDRYPGNGLGLPICRHIALAHGGGIAVASALGRGSCFTVTLGKDPP